MDTPTRFAKAVGELRHWADMPFRELARLSGYSLSRLSDAINPDKPLPTLDLVTDIVPILDPDGDLALWEAAWRRARRHHIGQPSRRAKGSVPRQLPGTPADFTGRTALLRRLDAAREHSSGRPAASIVVVTGSGGVGKTATVVHWAHRNAVHFPDGQLFADLAGFGPGPARDPGEILAGFLRGLGIPPQQIPPSTHDRAAALRDRLATLRVLIVCDNARDADQLEPLLPGDSGCLLLITSRSMLTGLRARHGATHLSVDRMTGEESIELAGALVGERVTAEPEAAAEFVELCARLPIALRVAAQHVADNPRLRLSELVVRMKERGITFYGDPDDAHADLSRLFSWSLNQLPAHAIRLFTVLGLYPGGHIELPALAALAGSSRADTESTVVALSHANLIDEPGPDRYAMHDLLRSYCAGLAANLPPGDAEAARRRLADYYIHSLAAAKDTEHPWDAPDRRDRLPGSDRWMRRFSASHEAADWLDLELDNLVSLARDFTAHGRHQHASWLSILLWRRLHLHARLDEAKVVHAAALSTAELQGDLAAVGAAQFRIGDVWWRVGEHGHAESWFLKALQSKETARDEPGTVHVLSGLGTVCHCTGRFQEAIGHFESGLAVARRLGDASSEVVALHNLGEIHMKLGRWPEAVERFGEAVDLGEQTNDRADLANALAGLCQALSRRGDTTAAEAVGQRAHALAVEVGSKELLGEVLLAKGIRYLCLGRRAEAGGHLRKARELFAASHSAEGLARVADALTELG